MGIDNSPEMLEIAEQKKKKTRINSDLLEFKEFDIRQIDLANSYDAAICIFGGFCYLLEDDDLTKFFNSAYKLLNERKGILVFEFWQKVYEEEKKKFFAHGKQSIEIEVDGIKIKRFSDAKWDGDIIIKTYEFTISNIKTGNEERFVDEHTLRCHSVAEMESILKANRFTLLDFYDEEGINEKKFPKATNKTFRILCLAKPSGPYCFKGIKPK